MRRLLEQGWIIREVVLLLGLVLPSAALALGIDDVSVTDNDERTRVVFELTETPEYRLFRLSDPHRVVIDFQGGELEAEELPAGGVLERIRSGRREGGKLRMVLDLEEAVEPRSFVMAGDGGGERLVVDLPHEGKAERQVVRSASERRRRSVVIAIDAGHGGVDPGAIGPKGTHEKDVVLEVAHRIRDLMKEAPRLEPLMIREGDYYMGLRDRTRAAHEGDADVFLSIHADGAKNPRVKGATVYALSLDGATSEQARVMAQRENAADYIRGVSLEDKDDKVASVLVDLSRGHTIEASLEMGNVLLPKIDQHADLLRKQVEQAGFAVLKSLDMPSLLVELGFITNSEEEQRLLTASYQRKLAEGIVAGVQEYAEGHLLPQMERAEGEDEEAQRREHTVERGESLSVIAQRYQVSVERLRTANDLSGERIQPGTTLVIP